MFFPPSAHLSLCHSIPYWPNAACFSPFSITHSTELKMKGPLNSTKMVINWLSALVAMRQRWKPQQLQFIFNPGKLAMNGIIRKVIICWMDVLDDHLPSDVGISQSWKSHEKGIVNFTYGYPQIVKQMPGELTFCWLHIFIFPIWLLLKLSDGYSCPCLHTNAYIFPNSNCNLLTGDYPLCDIFPTVNTNHGSLKPPAWYIWNHCIVTVSQLSWW